MVHYLTKEAKASDDMTNEQKEALFKSIDETMGTYYFTDEDALCVNIFEGNDTTKIKYLWYNKILNKMELERPQI